MAALGLEAGLTVRFRRLPGEQWQLATLERVEADGSLGLRDRRGGARAIPIERVELAGLGPRGARIWEPAAHRIFRPEQLRLL